MPLANLTMEPAHSNQELETRVLRFLYLKGVEDIDVEADGAVVTLRGRVFSERARRLCLDYCRHIPGVLHVQDELEIEEEIRKQNRPPVKG